MLFALSDFPAKRIVANSNTKKFEVGYILKNGNTLITDEKDILTREVNLAKEIVWELRPTVEQIVDDLDYPEIPGQSEH